MNVGACLFGALFSFIVIRSNFFRTHPWHGQLLFGIIAITTATLLFIWYFNDF
jgi:hypothetical protein